MFKRLLGVTALLCLIITGSALAVTLPTLQLDPVNGALSGTPGATVGWGFTITNNADFLVVNNANFSTLTSLGSFTDYIGPQFFPVGPSPENTTWTQLFNTGIQTGIGSFTIDPGALLGTVALGDIILNYDLYSVSPNDLDNFNPDIDLLSAGNILRAQASVTVTDVNIVPEPTTGLLLLFGAGVLGLSCRRRMQQA